MPFLISVALKVLVEILSHVSTGCSALSASSGTQPVVPLGRIGSRTLQPHLLVVVGRAGEHEHEVVGALTGLGREPGRPSSRESFGSAFAGTFCSTNAKYDSRPSFWRLSTLAAYAGAAAAKNATAAAATTAC